MNNKNNNGKWYDVIIDLVIHCIVGLAHFLAMALPAVLIYWFNKWLATIGVAGMTMFMLYGLETLLLLFDFYAVCRYIYHSTKDDFKE